MKMAKFYLVSICLVLATVTLALKAVKNKKEAAILSSQLTLKQGGQNQKPSQASDSETIAVKHLIDGLAKKYAVDIPITAEKDSRIKIGGTREADKEENGDKNAQQAPGQKTAADGKNQSYPVLNNYEGLIGFLNAIAGIPYILEYENGCIGQGCGNGIELTIVVKKPPTAG